MSFYFFDDGLARSRESEREKNKKMTNPAPALAAYRNLLRAAAQGERVRGLADAHSWRRR